MAIFEQECQIDSHASLGNKPAPPGVAPLIGDGVMHDAAMRSLLLEAVLVDEESEWAFDNFILQQMRWLHRFPPASPAHGDDPPIPAMQLDQAALLRRAIGFQADESQGRRHDFGEIVRIAVESEHLFRACGEWCAGVEN